MSLMRYSSLCAANRWVFHADLKPSVLRAGSRSDSGNEFHSIGPATENARWPNVLRRCRGPVNWWRMADKKRWRLGTSDVRVQQSIRYWRTLFCRHGWGELWFRVYTGHVVECPANAARNEAVGTSRDRTSGFHWPLEQPRWAPVETCPWRPSQHGVIQ